MSNDLSHSLKALESLYHEIPPVPCKACGECCVSPTITLLELIYLFDGMFLTCPYEKIQSILDKPTIFHPKCEGNLECRFMDTKGLCTIHMHRSMACRLHGLPVIEELKIPGQEICRNMPVASLPKVPVERLRQWLDKLSELNTKIAPYYTEPYWVSGLNIECWLAVIYDPYIDDEPFRQIATMLKRRYPKLSDLRYEDATQLKTKLDKISLFHEMSKIGISEDLMELLDAIVNGFPNTGTYYTKETEDFRKAIGKGLKKK